MELQPYYSKRAKHYPQFTDFKCPECGARVDLDCAIMTLTDHEGNPEEHESEGYYCSNKTCRFNVDPIDYEELIN